MVDREFIFSLEVDKPNSQYDNVHFSLSQSTYLRKITQILDIIMINVEGFPCKGQAISTNCIEPNQWTRAFPNWTKPSGNFWGFNSPSMPINLDAQNPNKGGRGWEREDIKCLAFGVMAIIEALMRSGDGWWRVVGMVVVVVTGNSRWKMRVVM